MSRRYWAFALPTGNSRISQAVIGTFRRNMPSNNVIHGFSHGQPVGKCSVSLRAEPAIRVATEINLFRVGGGRFHQCRVTGQCRCSAGE